MPSRVTSAFLRTVRVLLHERASDYVMWVAGHGADAATINTYLESINTFPSHFEEWSQHHGRDTILASIPALRTLMPSLSSPQKWQTDLAKQVNAETDAKSVPVPKIIETVVTLALQHHIMSKDQEQKRYTGNGQPSLSGQHMPSLNIDFLADTLTGPK